MNTLYIVAMFHFREEYLLEATDLLRELVYETRKEEGCLQYDLIADSENPGVYFLMEQWKSDEFHLRHSASAHLSNFRKKAAPLFESTAEVYRGTKLF